MPRTKRRGGFLKTSLAVPYQKKTTTDQLNPDGEMLDRAGLPEDEESDIPTRGKISQRHKLEWKVVRAKIDAILKEQ